MNLISWRDVFSLKVTGDKRKVSIKVGGSDATLKVL